MKKIFLVLLLGMILQQSHAQIPDDTNGWLYRLCKTWGYVKYFNQHKCGIAWDELLNTAITEVLAANGNSDFNSGMLEFLNQAGNNAPVVNPPALPDTNLNFNDDWIRDPNFSQPVRNFLETFSKYIYPDQSDCLIKGKDYSIDFSNDLITIPIDYSKEANRLTVMFYYWNVINYFSPYRNIMDQPWDTTLREFIPLIRKAANSTDFKKSFLKFQTKINDSHVASSSSVTQNPLWGGNYVPDISFKKVDSLCVVTDCSSIQNVSVGDILTAINEVSIQTIVDSLKHYIPASTPAAFYRDLYKYMLRGQKDTWINLTFTNRNAQSYIVRAKRAVTWGKSQHVISANSYFITTCGYGYVNMGKLISEEVSAMYATLKNAPVIIFDIRNYPNGTYRDIARLLFPGPATNAMYYLPALKGFLTPNYLPGWYYQYSFPGNSGGWSNMEPYTGQVILLVNQESQSHAEFTCQYLSIYPNVKVMGTQTTGADGDVSLLNLPGGLIEVFTSVGWYYADGYQQQRNGVKIDSVVAPTAQGIRDGKDEILLAALDCISGIDNQAIKSLDILVYPNPVISGSVTVSFTLSRNSEINISLIDLSGKMILQEIRSYPAGEQAFILDLPQVSPGFYLLKTQTGQASAVTKLQIR